MAKGADCKSAGLRLRRFESYLPHHEFKGLTIRRPGMCPPHAPQRRSRLTHSAILLGFDHVRRHLDACAAIYGLAARESAILEELVADPMATANSEAIALRAHFATPSMTSS